MEWSLQQNLDWDNRPKTVYSDYHTEVNGYQNIMAYHESQREDEAQRNPET